MTCLHPLFAYRSLSPNKNGKYELGDFKDYRKLMASSSAANARQSLADGTAMVVPCGQCLSCRLDKANEWAIRCVHEAKMHVHNCFITLTYNNDCVPADMSLHREHLQLFIKRLRRYADYHGFSKIRFLCCGEYGGENARPHYHIICFGYFPKDVRKVSNLSADYNLFYSPTLEKLWPYGYNTVGAVNFESARYVAKYSLKKQTGKNAAIYQELGISPEFVGASLKPGIGADYFKKYAEDIFKLGFCTMNGVKFPIPKYYQELFGRENPVWLDVYKDFKRQNAKLPDPKRLEAKEQIMKKRQAQFERALDSLE